MLHLDISRDTHKVLDKLPPKQFRQIVMKILDLLKTPEPNDSKRLTGYPYHRTDCGEYRIVYTFSETLLSIILVGKRNDDEVYKQLSRK